MGDTQAGVEALHQMIAGYWVTQAIHVAAELGIADLLADGVETPDELAERTQTDGKALYRVLRALASVGIFAEDGGRRFTLTPLAEYLRSDVPGSQRGFARMNGVELYETWGQLLYSVQTGEEAFRKMFGVPVFQYLAEQPERGSVFDAGWAGVHGGEAEPMLEAYDFSSFRTVVDVGGGKGQLLTVVLQRHPAVKGILFDLPAVADRARSAIAKLGLADRCQVVGGDFFAEVPAGADAYVLRHVIHDWEDAEAVAILRTCREAMGPGSKVLVVEKVIPLGNDPCLAKWLDLMMLVVGGRERTEDQYRHLFTEAGLELTRVVPANGVIDVVEGVCGE